MANNFIIILMYWNCSREIQFILIKNFVPECISFLTFQFSAQVENNVKKNFLCLPSSIEEWESSKFVPTSKGSGKSSQKAFLPQWNKLFPLFNNYWSKNFLYMAQSIEEWKSESYLENKIGTLKIRLKMTQIDK